MVYDLERVSWQFPSNQLASQYKDLRMQHRSVPRVWAARHPDKSWSPPWPYPEVLKNLQGYTSWCSGDQVGHYLSGTKHSPVTFICHVALGPWALLAVVPYKLFDTFGLLFNGRACSQYLCSYPGTDVVKTDACQKMHICSMTTQWDSGWPVGCIPSDDFQDYRCDWNLVPRALSDLGGQRMPRAGAKINQTPLFHCYRVFQEV